MDFRRREIDIQASLSALKDAFEKKIPTRVNEFEQLWNTLKSNPGDRSSCQVLHRKAHSLSGSLATFGFDEASGFARAIERLLEEALAEDVSIWPKSFLGRVETLLTQLKKASVNESNENSGYAMKWVEPLTPFSGNDRQQRLIYLVDHDKNVLKTMATQIGAFGYDVECFSDFKLFSDAVDRMVPAVVVMDVVFGGSATGGIEHIARINANRTQPLKSIFIHGSSDIQVRLEAVRANGQAYFPEPVEVERLVDVIEQLTQKTTEEPYRVLVVDDSKHVSEYTALVLQQAGIQTMEVNDPFALLDVAAEFSPDLILMDIYMPGCSGLELSNVIRQIPFFVSTPIVFLSAEPDLKKQMNAMSLGGDDFLSKPIEPWHLVSSVTTRAQRGRLIRKLADTDGLTGLLNHTKSKEVLEAELSRADREATVFSFAMLDIDLFKDVNDNYGHPAGDRVLKVLASMLKQRLRRYDSVGRYGGEEFVVILPGTNAQAAKVIMEDILTGFGKIRHNSGDRFFNCSFSCGIASYPVFDRVVTLNDEADKALYEAKRKGRNQVIISSGCCSD